MRYLEQNMTDIERMAENISKIHAEISEVKETVNDFMERKDRECNPDEELTLLQYLL